MTTADPTNERLVRTLALVGAAEASDVFGAPLIIRHAGALEGTNLFEGYFAEIGEATSTSKGKNFTLRESDKALFQKWKSQIFSQLENNCAIAVQRIHYTALFAALERQKSAMSLAFIASNPRESYTCFVIPMLKKKFESFSSGGEIEIVESPPSSTLSSAASEPSFVTTNKTLSSPDIVTKVDSDTFVCLCPDSDVDSPSDVFCATTNMEGRFGDAVVEPLGESGGIVLSLTGICAPRRPASPSDKKKTDDTDTGKSPSATATTTATTTNNGQHSNSGRPHIGALEIVDRSFRRARVRGALLNTQSIGAINEFVMEGKVQELAETEECRFQVDLLEGIDEFKRKKSGFQLILISGPSASGKTTFAHRLSEALSATGTSNAVLSADDYYRDIREKGYPKLPNGKPNCEVVEALRIEFFQKQVEQIFNGETVETPIFDMKLSRPKEKGRNVKLTKGSGVLIVEGLFCLSPALTSQIPDEKKVRLFVCPLPQFAATELSVIPNSTVRTLRRISRDYLFRGRGAAQTITRLSALLSGEQGTVLPTLKYADYVFNSTMDHELNIVSPFSMPLLARVLPSDEDAFATASKLMSFIRGVLPATDKDVPDFSLLREFIGGSAFDEELIEEQMLYLQKTQAGGHHYHGRDGGGAAAKYAAIPFASSPANAATPPAAEHSSAWERAQKRAAVIQQRLVEFAQNATYRKLLEIAQTKSKEPTTATSRSRSGGRGGTDEDGEEEPLFGVSSPTTAINAMHNVTYLGSKSCDSERPIGVVVDGKLRSLDEPVDFKSSISFPPPSGTASAATSQSLLVPSNSNTVKDVHAVYASGTFGAQICTSTSALVLCAAVFNWNRERSCTLLHGLGYGRRATRWVAEIRSSLPTSSSSSKVDLTKEDITAIQVGYTKLVERNAPIRICVASNAEAMEMLAACGQLMACSLLEHSLTSHVLVAICDDFCTLFVEPVAPSTGTCSPLAIQQWFDKGDGDDGDDDDEDDGGDGSSCGRAKAPSDAPATNLILASAFGWDEEPSRGTLLFDRVVRKQRALLQTAIGSLRCVGDINRFVVDNQEAKAKRIADYLSLETWMNLVRRVKRERIKYLVVDGPRASGKTKFTKTLIVAFASCGVKCRTIVCSSPNPPFETIQEETPSSSANAPAAAATKPRSTAASFYTVKHLLAEEEGAQHQEVVLVDVNRAAAAVVEPDESAKKKNKMAPTNDKHLRLFVAPLSLFNITEQLPVSASDIRRVRKIGYAHSVAELIESSSPPPPPSDDPTNMFRFVQSDSTSLMSNENVFSTGTSMVFSPSSMSDTMSGSCSPDRRYSVIESGAMEVPFLEADAVINTSDVFEMTRAKHRVVQRLRLVARMKEHTSNLPQGVSVSRVIRALDFFLGDGQH